MHQIVYASSSRKNLPTDELNAILESARTTNSTDEITGILLYNDGNFLQVLEGDKDAIHTCYAKISKDSRHHGIIKLLDEPIDERAFKQWSMAYMSYDELTGPQKVGFSELMSLGTEDVGGKLSTSQVVVRTYLKILKMG